MVELLPDRDPRGGPQPRRGRSESAAGQAAADAGAAGSGLVISTLISRISSFGGEGVEDRSSGAKPDLGILDDFRLGFSPVELVEQAASLFGNRRWDGREGPVPMIEVSPGSVRLLAPDLNRQQKRLQRQVKVHRDDVAQIVDELQAGGSLNKASSVDNGDEPVRGAISGWSRRSRAKMVLRLSELDYRPLFEDLGCLPAMVTLTYPGNWEEVAGDGRAVKRHFEMLLKRYERAWGQEWTGLWKLEFQGRGAPHFHLFMVPPLGQASATRKLVHEAALSAWEEAGKEGPRPRYRRAFGDGLHFMEWLSQTWADIVSSRRRSELAQEVAQATGPLERRVALRSQAQFLKHYCRHISAGTRVDLNDGLRAADPRRLAVYFTKHGLYGEKEYQNQVPEIWQQNGGPGRFWGYRGLSPLRRRAVITPKDQLLIGRTLRKLSQRRRYWDPEKGCHYWVKSPRRLFKHNAGFLAVNSGPKLAYDLARLVHICGFGGLAIPESPRVSLPGGDARKRRPFRRSDWPLLPLYEVPGRSS